MITGGNKINMPASKREIPAKVKKPEGGDAKGGKAEVKESSEDVEVGGKKLKCKVVESNTEASGTKTHSKVWTSHDVPGGTVKMESHSEGAAKSATTMTCSAFEAK
jgi:hypothetical protein